MATSNATGTTSAGTGDATIGRYVSTVTAVYLTMGIGTALTLFLFATFAGGTGGIGPSTMMGVGGGGQLATYVFFAWMLLIFVGPLVTTLVAVAVGRNCQNPGAGAVAGAISNVVGVLVTLTVLLALGIVVAASPTGAGGLGRQLGRVLLAFVGIGIGVGITGALGGFVGGRTVHW